MKDNNGKLMGYQVANVRFECEGQVMVAQVKIKALWFTGVAHYTGDLAVAKEACIQDALREAERSDLLPYADRPEVARGSGGGYQQKKPNEAKCSTCLEPIRLFKPLHDKDKWHRVSPESTQAGDREYNPERHKNHVCKPKQQQQTTPPKQAATAPAKSVGLPKEAMNAKSEPSAKLSNPMQDKKDPFPLPPPHDQKTYDADLEKAKKQIWAVAKKIGLTEKTLADTAMEIVNVPLSGLNLALATVLLSELNALYKNQQAVAV